MQVELVGFWSFVICHLLFVIAKKLANKHNKIYPPSNHNC
ncbi:hypothetical protein FDUTEX481_05143 [Tolypothrix sp. PCC 7601]|nr:hypothetical protein FDUTEX481_05143 [Tolypothrix sp. PCC 7601]